MYVELYTIRLFAGYMEIVPKRQEGANVPLQFRFGRFAPNFPIDCDEDGAEAAEAMATAHLAWLDECWCWSAAIISMRDDHGQSVCFRGTLIEDPELVDEFATKQANTLTSLCDTRHHSLSSKGDNVVLQYAFIFTWIVGIVLRCRRKTQPVERRMAGLSFSSIFLIRLLQAFAHIYRKEA